MLPPRRFLPSFSLLAAFEAAARTGSVTAAAGELDLTQSAVSRQIAALERQLGVALFRRERQTIRLTLAGDTYAREVREALRRISNASLNLRANPAGGTLNLAAPAFFCARWLTARLPLFLAAHPGIVVNLVTRQEPFDFRFEPLDAAIHFGEPRFPGASLTLLMKEEVRPFCSPSFKADHGLIHAEHLLNAPLLHLASRPDGWELWLGGNDVAFGTIHGMLFDQMMPMVEAAIAGMGVALLPQKLVGREIEAGHLVEAAAGKSMATGDYYLAYPPDRDGYPPLVAFRDWITREIEAGS